MNHARSFPRPHLPRNGEDFLLWIAVLVAVVFFSFLLFDLIVHWRRKRHYQKRVAEATAKEVLEASQR